MPNILLTIVKKFKYILTALIEIFEFRFLYVNCRYYTLKDITFLFVCFLLIEMICLLFLRYYRALFFNDLNDYRLVLCRRRFYYCSAAFYIYFFFKITYVVCCAFAAGLVHESLCKFWIDYLCLTIYHFRLLQRSCFSLVEKDFEKCLASVTLKLISN